MAYDFSLSIGHHHCGDAVFDFRIENERSFFVISDVVENFLGERHNAFEQANAFLYSVQDILRNEKNFSSNFRIYFGITKEREMLFYLANEPNKSWKLLYKTEWLHDKDEDANENLLCAFCGAQASTFPIGKRSLAHCTGSGCPFNEILLPVEAWNCRCRSRANIAEYYALCGSSIFSRRDFPCPLCGSDPFIHSNELVHCSEEACYLNRQLFTREGWNTRPFFKDGICPKDGCCGVLMPYKNAHGHSRYRCVLCRFSCPAKNGKPKIYAI
jgi:hypothetical protein